MARHETNYDYIIVGAGSAGCTLANRLTADKKNKVLLLEAGGMGQNFLVDLPAGYLRTMVDPNLNWLFETEPEHGLDNRIIPIPRGKALGGSSAINGMLYVRGQARDYDGWAQLGNRGWSFKDLLPYFKKMESRDSNTDYLRGKNGPVNVANITETFPILDSLMEAAEEAGYPKNQDYNGENQEGFSYYQVTQKIGRRESSKTAYLDPARNRSNLHVQTKAQVTHLIINNKQVDGVEFKIHDRLQRCYADHEVILCAGSIQSPQLLELSGVGRPEIIKAQGINVIHELPGVGENLQDHYISRLVWEIKNASSLNQKTRGINGAVEAINYLLFSRGALTLPPGVLCGFVKSAPELETPDIQYHIVNASFENPKKRVFDRFPGLTIGPCQLRPESRGSVHIKSPNPFSAPAIRQNFLTTDLDCQIHLRGMRIARDLLNTAAMTRYREREVTPGPRCQSDDELLDYARSTGSTLYHPVGTCKMGNDMVSVVDDQLRIKGMEKLRIVDGSIMPRLVSGNTNAPIIMIAEKAADLILKVHK
ncbi:MAG: choline dehydrogenase [Rhodospirillaceae bacterium TMED8]|nr:choline dehydrogenase [Magnetovibrio sp.]OUT49623.1 MAG: choline dehydrogenase [Rhodospirillaceae bacterium TMED8]|tara:strand:+ start:529 stop:2136 length:1608 start_codon:yes stop_codon:yes gene_type:complete